MRVVCRVCPPPATGGMLMGWERLGKPGVSCLPSPRRPSPRLCLTPPVSSCPPPVLPGGSHGLRSVAASGPGSSFVLGTGTHMSCCPLGPPWLKAFPHCGGDTCDTVRTHKPRGEVVELPCAGAACCHGGVRVSGQWGGARWYPGFQALWESILPPVIG